MKRTTAAGAVLASAAASAVLAAPASALLPVTTISTIPTTISTLDPTTISTLPTTISTFPTTITTFPTTITTFPTTITTFPTTISTFPTTITTIATLDPTTASTTAPATTAPATTAPATTAPATTAPETTATTSTTLPTGGGLPGGQTEPPKPPTLTIAGLTGNLGGGVFSVGFTATAPGTTTGLLYLTGSLAKSLHLAKAKLVLIGSGKKVTTAAGPAKLNVKLKKKARKQLKGEKKVKAILQLKTVDANGLASPVVTKKVTLKKKH